MSASVHPWARSIESSMIKLHVILVVALIVLPVYTVRAGLPDAPAASLGFDAERLKRIDACIDRAIEHHDVVRAVLADLARASGLGRPVNIRGVEDDLTLGDWLAL